MKGNSVFFTCKYVCMYVCMGRSSGSRSVGRSEFEASKLKGNIKYQKTKTLVKYFNTIYNLTLFKKYRRDKLIFPRTPHFPWPRP